MRLNWAMGITAIYLIFALVMIGLVLFSTTQRVELVSQNYYENEIKYQSHIETVKRTQELKEKPIWNIRKDKIEILFPASIDERTISGTYKFYRPSNSGADFTIPVKLIQHSQNVDIAKLIKGMWKLQISWRMNGIDYYDETVFFKE